MQRRLFVAAMIPYAGSARGVITGGNVEEVVYVLVYPQFSWCGSLCKAREMAWRGKSALESAQTGISCHNHFLFGMAKGGEEKRPICLISSHSTLWVANHFLFPCATPFASKDWVVCADIANLTRGHYPSVGGLFSDGALTVGSTVQGLVAFSWKVSWPGAEGAGETKSPWSLRYRLL